MIGDARRLLVTWLAAASIAVSAATAEAQPIPDEPAAAYELGQQAFERKDYPTAARAFARADELAPSDAALESALKAALLADDPALGMELCERTEGRQVGRGLKPLVDRAKKAFDARAGRLTVRCPSPECVVAIDGRAVVVGKAVWAPVGMRAVTVTVGSHVQREQVEVRSGTTVELVATAPPPSATVSGQADPIVPVVGGSGGAGSASAAGPPAIEDHGRGISPAFFIVTAVATGVLTGVTIWSGVDTLGIHDDFEAGNAALRDGGIDAQLRTNVLIGFSAGGGAATILLGIFTDFGGGEPVSTPPASQARLFPLPHF